MALVLLLRCVLHLQVGFRRYFIPALSEEGEVHMVIRYEYRLYLIRASYRRAILRAGKFFFSLR